MKPQGGSRGPTNSTEVPLDQTVNQIMIESKSSLLMLNSYSRLKFIENQRKNRYSPLNLPPFVVHIESKNTSENLGNVHPKSESRKTFSQ